MDLENTLRMTDHLALTRDGIHFNNPQGRRWINDVFQTRIEEKEEKLRTTDALARTSLTNRLGPLTPEAGVAAPAAPKSDVVQVTCPRQPASTSASNMPATTSASEGS